ncbi:flocculation-associated PEP-CTERM protein PepA [Pseudocolwellia sp. HL-MZ19]|uniref:flocculation-associated PEP-CTERM protein PepA n=1 Tax=unclassified Pseudocolwellia TaxID=2848178 RepID=UPI003CECB4F5
MKKLLLASLVTATSFGASASSVITFDDSSFNNITNSTVVFDEIQFTNDPATVTQTDSTPNGSTYGGPDSFVEVGSTDALAFALNNATTNVDPAYEIFYDYSLIGTSEVVTLPSFPGFAGGDYLSVSFTANAGTSGLYLDTTVNTMLNTVNTQLASFTVNSGGTCLVRLSNQIGNCNIDLDISFAAGYFFDAAGNDLATQPGAQTASLVVTVDDIGGYSVDYNGGQPTQEFKISHDGHMTFDVPEPASVAILGLGLLGFAGARRRKA